MNADRLRALKNKAPFRPFRIRMSDGSEFEIKDPEKLVIHPDWTVDAIVLLPRGRFSFLYLRNVASVTSEGTWPPIRRRRGRKGPSDSE